MALSPRSRWWLAGLVFCVGACLRAYVVRHLGRADGDWSGEFAMIAVGMLPYLILCTLIVKVFSLAGTLLAGIVVVWSDFGAVHEGVHGSSSTSGVALVVQPIFVLVIVLPAVFVLDWFIFLRRRT